MPCTIDLLKVDNTLATFLDFEIRSLGGSCGANRHEDRRPFSREIVAEVPGIEPEHRAVISRNSVAIGWDQRVDCDLSVQIATPFGPNGEGSTEASRDVATPATCRSRGMPTLDSGEHRSEAGGQTERARDTPRSVPLDSAAATAPRTVEDALRLAAKLAIGEGAYERAMAVLELLVARAHDNVEVAHGSGGRSGRRSA
jgi:hypothetical protein